MKIFLDSKQQTKLSAALMYESIVQGEIFLHCQIKSPWASSQGQSVYRRLWICLNRQYFQASLLR